MAVGSGALYGNSTGTHGTALGYGALNANTTGSNNAGMDVYAFFSNAIGNNNVAMDQPAGYYVTGSNNIDIGSKATAADNAAGRPADR